MADIQTNPDLKYCVAVASTDGETVNTHYGKATLHRFARMEVIIRHGWKNI